MLDFHIATDPEKREAFTQVHAVWPHARDPDVHLVKRLHAVQQSRAEWFVGSAAKGVAVSCGAYPFTLFGPKGEKRQAIAFGAVYTDPESRGRGYAAELIRFVQTHYQKAGIQDFILYSDIDPLFYERLGFLRLPSQSFKITARALAKDSPWSLSDAELLVIDPGCMGHEFGLSLSQEELVWAQAKQELPLHLTRFSRPDGSYWALSAIEGGNYQLLMSNIPQDFKQWPIFEELMAADAHRFACPFAKGWLSTPSQAHSTAQNISERKDGILMWSSLLGEKDPWRSQITGKAFLSFPLLQI